MTLTASTRLRKVEHLTRAAVTAGAILVIALLVANVVILWSPTTKSVLYAEWLPSAAGTGEQQVGRHVWKSSREPAARREIQDEHPGRKLMQDADYQFEQYDKGRSKTFKETVEKYRERYGRHPPPGFQQWYKFARKRKVHNIDDFQQINDDLRPFWGLQPSEIRRYAAHASDDSDDAVSTVSLRAGQVSQQTWGWRSKTFIGMLETVARWLPDMDIPVNRLDQPRVLVPWEQLQEYLRLEERTRSLGEEGVRDVYTKGMSGFRSPHPHAATLSWWQHWNPFWFPQDHQLSTSRPTYGWFPYPGQQYMDLAAQACPPEAYARNTNSTAHFEVAERSYQSELGGFITNFNLSSDLCTVGPQLSHLHGMLYASTSMLATQQLVPIFGECKVNVNNDILFPANMYWKHDRRYEFDDEQDLNWDDKEDVMVWRGATSGGMALADQPQLWRQMHRQRLVLMTNATELGNNSTAVLALDSHQSTQIDVYRSAEFQPATFAELHTDIGFTDKTACIPNCSFYDSIFSMLDHTTFASTFRNKYVIDVDGMSFSGRWRAFLQSRSLGLKATIFREWHNSRLFAWRHFVPLDNRYNELYSLLTYFIGTGEDAGEVRVERHDYEAYKMAKQGKKWAAKVLRREDIEIYLYRLLLEYGRIIDDNRDAIGVVGDGGQEMVDFDEKFPAVE